MTKYAGEGEEEKKTPSVLRNLCCRSSFKADEIDRSIDQSINQSA